MSVIVWWVRVCMRVCVLCVIEALHGSFQVYNMPCAMQR